MNTRLQLTAIFLFGIIFATGIGVIAQERPNARFVIDDTLNYTIWDQPAVIGPVVRLIITSDVRKEIAAWLSNNTPVCYVEGAEYYVYRVTLSADRAIIELMRM